MAKDSKKCRASIDDIRGDREILKDRSDTVKAVGEKLVMDSKQLEATKNFIESLDMPESDKARTIAHLNQQKQLLNKTFEMDVEKPTRELEAEQKELAHETSEYADNARKNKEKLGDFRKESGMDDSGIKQAHKEQSRYEIEYRNEQKIIADEMKKQERDVAELRRRAVGNS
jgi:hypothetical protein